MIVALDLHLDIVPQLEAGTDNGQIKAAEKHDRIVSLCDISLAAAVTVTAVRAIEALLAVLGLVLVDVPHHVLSLGAERIVEVLVEHVGYQADPTVDHARLLGLILGLDSGGIRRAIAVCPVPLFFNES